jgi:hypothetical protein
VTVARERVPSPQSTEARSGAPDGDEGDVTTRVYVTFVVAWRVIAVPPGAGPGRAAGWSLTVSVVGTGYDPPGDADGA